MEDKRTEQYRQELKEFVMSHTEDVLKNPRSFIRYPFIDPGSVYDGNVWDWDTYWSVYGFLNLADSYQDPSVKPRIIEHAQGNIRNFFDHQLEDGYIPLTCEAGFREWDARRGLNICLSIGPRLPVLFPGLPRHDKI